MYEDKTIELRTIIGIRMTHISKFSGMAIVGRARVNGSPPWLMAE